MYKFSRSASLLLIALTFLAVSLPTVAQSPLTLTGLNGTPAISGGSLGAPFDPDPFPIEGVSGGGGVRIALLNPNSGCLGRYNEAPSFGFNLLQPLDFLRIFFVADDPDADATLIVRMPDQQYYCADDFKDGNNPLVDVVGNATSGGVHIWVGSLYAEPVTGTLYLSTGEDAHPFNLEEIASSAVIGLDPSAEPQSSASGTSVDPLAAPLTSFVQAGGEIDVHSLDLAPDCTGYTTAEPTFRIAQAGNRRLLRFYFTANDPAADATLIVQDPNGDFACNDDSFDMLNPTVDFDESVPGPYTVWVGAANRNETINGELTITYRNVYFPGSTFEQQLISIPMPESPPTDRNLIYEDVTVEGVIDISEEQIDSDCIGYTSPEPTKAFRWFLVNPYDVRVYFVADDEVDTTLIVLAPQGWVCNDNSFDTPHPTVDLPIAGLGTPKVEIWIGTHEPNVTVTGTLYVVYDQESNPASPATP